MRILSVAIPRPLDGLFTYKLPVELSSQVQVGGWVKVPFGRSVTHAFVVEAPRDFSELPSSLSQTTLKEVLEVGPGTPLFPDDILALCKWAQEYYCAPLGEVLNCAVPSHFLKPNKQKPFKKVQKDGIDVQLTDEQSEALQFLEHYRTAGKPMAAVLQGVTGSGKTEVYIELAKNTLASGRSVLILVPEIALTPQLYRRFEQRLGVSIALWHSAVSPGKRRSQAEAIRKGDIQIVIGARSAVFAPLQNLGLIVVDEEHDPTYKQEDRVRYHARDLSVVRGKITKSLVVLGSATPSLETRERVREGRYVQAELKQRISSGGFPEIEMIHLGAETLAEEVQAPIALTTMQAIQSVIEAGEQVIVYLNRRGFAHFLLCQECNDVKGCSKCSVTLTVHKRRGNLQCHLCGHFEPIPDFCRKCNGIELYPVGSGTESMEEDLSRWIPGAKVLRLDRDQITSSTRLEKCLDEFRNKSANILLGTQMLVKGHDFPNVTLVVVILADSLFRWPDFRASERAYQVLKQVSGRSGRGEKKGKVLIQTFDPNHPVLQTLDGRMSEESFLNTERDLRQLLNYPPFGRLARIRFESQQKDEVVYRSNTVADYLQGLCSEQSFFEVLGPSEAFLEKVNGLFRWDILIRARQIDLLQKALLHTRKLCHQEKWSFSIDVDPYS